LTLDNSLDSLVVLYLSSLQSVTYGTRHIIQEMNSKGYRISKLFMTGGGLKNKLYVKTVADICNCKVYIPVEEEAVLLGT